LDYFEGTKYEKISEAIIDEDTENFARIIRTDTIDINYHEPKFGWTLLHLAVANAKQKSAEKLLQLGAEISAQTKRNESPLIFACTHYISICNDEMVNLLLSYGADPNETYYYAEIIDEEKKIYNHIYSSPLISSVDGGCSDVVKLLISRGARINQYYYGGFYGPITAAIRSDQLEIAHYLMLESNCELPKYCLVRESLRKGEPGDSITITEYLMEKDYSDSEINQDYKRRIIDYLESCGYRE
jgi:hypothetical protein